MIDEQMDCMRNCQRRNEVHNLFNTTFNGQNDATDDTFTQPIIDVLKRYPAIAYKFFNCLQEEYLIEYIPDLSKYGQDVPDVGLFNDEDITRNIISVLTRYPIDRYFTQRYANRRSHFIDSIGGKTICCSIMMGRKTADANVNNPEVMTRWANDEQRWTDYIGEAVGVGLFNIHDDTKFNYPLVAELNEERDNRRPRDDTLWKTIYATIPNNQNNVKRCIESCFLGSAQSIHTLDEINTLILRLGTLMTFDDGDVDSSRVIDTIHSMDLGCANWTLYHDYEQELENGAIVRYPGGIIQRCAELAYHETFNGLKTFVRPYDDIRNGQDVDMTSYYPTLDPTIGLHHESAVVYFSCFEPSKTTLRFYDKQTLFKVLVYQGFGLLIAGSSPTGYINVSYKGISQRTLDMVNKSTLRPYSRGLLQQQSLVFFNAFQEVIRYARQASERISELIRGGEREVRIGMGRTVTSSKGWFRNMMDTEELDVIYDLMDRLSYIINGNVDVLNERIITDNVAMVKHITTDHRTVHTDIIDLTAITLMYPMQSLRMMKDHYCRIYAMNRRFVDTIKDIHERLAPDRRLTLSTEFLGSRSYMWGLSYDYQQNLLVAADDEQRQYNHLIILLEEGLAELSDEDEACSLEEIV